MECPYCKSNEIMHDYFEEEIFFWCGKCFREVDPEGEEDGCYDNANEGSIPGVEGKPS